MSRRPFYITTAIDYSNGDPHLGHALEKIGADVIARWHRLTGEPVRFMMGMDEHGQKVLQSAEAAGVDPVAWTAQISDRFESTWRRLGCSHDDWMRTTQPRHARTVTALIEQIRDRHPDHLFVGEYEGLYCVGCEEFKQESQIVDGRCIEHPSRELELTRERNTFFRLSAWRDEVLAAIESGSFRVEPAIRRNEILAVLRGGLQDISISRSRLSWGIPFPGSDNETVYVWFDALINYLSGTGFPDDGWDRLWPADLHVVGKGITRFHCIIWPAMLMAAGLPLPRQVWAHGYVQWGGAKVSKSEGVSISLDEAIDRHGPEALRWFLMREVGFEQDGDFTWDRFDARYNSDLADGLGNLASRITAMVVKYRDGVVPADQSRTDLDRAASACVAEYVAAISACDLRGGAAAIERLVGEADGFVSSSAPWALAKAGDAAGLDQSLAALTRTLLRLSLMSAPYMPEKSLQLWTALGQEGTPWGKWNLAEQPVMAGAKIEKPENL
ncbi:MAG TPA: methionine--tRNA ligase, partial [Gemmatimonadales bacterium]|nr:methionine--tRNA ligase [Gemmatimonadales bacterium]